MEELELTIASLNEHPTKEEIREMINEADADQDGSIDFQEFLSIMATKIKVIKRTIESFIHLYVFEA